MRSLGPTLALLLVACFPEVEQNPPIGPGTGGSGGASGGDDDATAHTGATCYMPSLPGLLPTVCSK